MAAFAEGIQPWPSVHTGQELHIEPSSALDEEHRSPLSNINARMQVVKRIGRGV
jgi:hypothetical protein